MSKKFPVKHDVPVRYMVPRRIKKVQVRIYVSDSMVIRVNNICHAEDIDRAEFIRNAIREHVEAWERKGHPRRSAG